MGASLVPVGGGHPILIDKPIYLIGRHPDCDAVLPSSSKVSRRHCCVAQVNERYLIRDLGSLNGIRINNSRISESELHTGDQIAIGDVCFVFKHESSNGRRKGSSNGHHGKATVGPEKMAAPRPDLSMEFPVPIDDPDEHSDKFPGMPAGENYDLDMDDVNLKPDSEG